MDCRVGVGLEWEEEVMESSYAPGEGGWGTLNFSFYVDLDQACPPPPKKKKYQNYQTYPKIIEIKQPPKNMPILYLNLKFSRNNSQK